MEAFVDELIKMATNIVNPLTPQTPAPVTTGSKPRNSMKAELKSTNYSIVNKGMPMAASGSAGSKSIPPPPVRT